MSELQIKMPSGLKPDGQKLWKQIVPQLIEGDVIKKIDASNLEALCFWWSVFCECKRQMDQMEDFSSMECVRLSGNLTRSYDCFRRACLEFGLTPLARNKIEINEATTPIAGAKFFGGAK